MHDRQNERVRSSIEEWRIDNELQKAIQELLRDDIRFCWAIATLIVMRHWDLLNSMRHLFYERYDFDIHRWLIKDLRDWASLPQGRNTQETNWIVALSMYYANWE